MGPKCYAVGLHCIVSGEENPQIAPSPYDCVTPPEKDQATAIGIIHKNFVKNRACGLGDMFADRQTHIRTHTHTHTLMTVVRYRSRGLDLT